MVIICAHAVCQPYAVMVLSRDTGFAETAMFAPCWFEELTGSAIMPRVKYDAVIGITGHLLSMVFRSYIGRGDDACIQEEVR